MKQVFQHCSTCKKETVQNLTVITSNKIEFICLSGHTGTYKPSWVQSKEEAELNLKQKNLIRLG